ERLGGELVARELAELRVVLLLLAQPVADVGEVAEAGRDVAHLDVRVQLVEAAAADAVDEVGEVVAANLRVGLGLRHRLAVALTLREELAAGDDALLEVEDVADALAEERRRLEAALLEDQERLAVVHHRDE